MYFYLAMVGFEPTPASTAAPSNTETTVIPSRRLRSKKKVLSYISHIYSYSMYINIYILILCTKEPHKLRRVRLGPSN